MIIGLGPGRTGSTSFSFWMNIWHEWKPLGWERPGPDWTTEKIEEWEKRMRANSDKWDKDYGDSAFQHIHLLDHWLERDDVDIVLLWREKEPTVKSLLKHPTPSHWQLAFPEFDFTTEEGVGEYYDWFYDTCFEHADKMTVIHPSQIPIVSNQTGKPVYEQVLTKRKPPPLPKDFQRRLEKFKR